MQRRCWLTILSLTIGLICGPLYAAADDHNNQMEEIVVTAEKLHGRSASEIPIAMSVLSGSDIEFKGYTETNELLRQTPGVVADQTGLGVSNISIRGASAAGDPTVGFYLDDLPFLLPQIGILPDLNPYDLDHVEVLRGPQGTLYGASSVGGTIRILTKAPVHNEFSAKFTAGYSAFDGGSGGYKAQGAVNVPLIDDKLSVRLVGSRIDRGGYIDLPLTGERNYNDSREDSYRARIRYTPSDAVELNASYWSFVQDTHVGYSDKNFQFSPYNLLYDFTLTPTGKTLPVTGDRMTQRMKYELSNLNATITLGDYQVYATASHVYLKPTESYDWNTATPYLTDGHLKSDTAELRMAYTGQQRWSWTSGLFYDKIGGPSAFGANYPLDTNPVTKLGFVVSNWYHSSEQFAAFGEVHYQLVPDRLTLTLGGRYFQDKRVEHELSSTTPVALGLLAAGLDLKRSATFDADTYRINLSYTPAKNSLYYINIAQGFRSGQVQCGICAVGIGAPPATKPEDMISYEIGSKLQLLDGALTLDLAGYYWTWKKIQVVQTTFTQAGFPTAYYDNVGSADAVGFDFGLNYSPIAGLVLGVSGNVNKTEYTDSLPSAGIADGDTVQYSPKYSGTVSASYDWPLTAGLKASVSAAYTMQGSTTIYSAYGPPIKSDSYSTLSARAGVHRKNWSMFLTAENLLDESAIRFQTYSDLLTGGTPYYLPPRSVGIEASVKF